MDNLPKEISLHVLFFVPDLLWSSRVCKRWKKLAEESIKHPFVAARYGDRLSLREWFFSYVPWLVFQLTATLMKNGHVQIAKTFLRKGKYAPDLYHVLASENEDMIFGAISGVYSMHYGDDEAWKDCSFECGKLGPDFIAFDLVTDFPYDKKGFYLGLCTGGHATYLVLYRNDITEYDDDLEFINDVVMAAVKSGDVPTLEYCLDEFWVFVCSYLSIYGILTEAFNSKKIEMIRHVLTLIRKAEPAAFEDTPIEEREDVIADFIEKRAHASTKEVYKFLVDEMGDTELCYRPLTTRTDEDLLMFLYESGVKDVHDYLKNKESCVNERFRLIDLHIAKNPDYVCSFCENKFHKGRRNYDDLQK